MLPSMSSWSKEANGVLPSASMIRNPLAVVSSVNGLKERSSTTATRPSFSRTWSTMIFLASAGTAKKPTAAYSPTAIAHARKMLRRRRERLEGSGATVLTFLELLLGENQSCSPSPARNTGRGPNSLSVLSYTRVPRSSTERIPGLKSAHAHRSLPRRRPLSPRVVLHPGASFLDQLPRCPPLGPRGLPRGVACHHRHQHLGRRREGGLLRDRGAADPALAVP